MTGSLVINIFRVLAACTSLMMILSPTPTIYRIHKTHDTGHMSIFPLLAVLFNCHEWMMYGYLDGNIFPIFITFLIGDILSLIYIVIFYRWTSQRSRANKLFVIFGIAIGATTIYAVLGGVGSTGQSHGDVVRIAGYFPVISSVVLYSAPLEKVIKVFRHKSAVFLPIQMVVAASINNVMWVIYTALISKWILFFPNAVMLVVGVFQTILYFFIYNPKTHPLSDDWKESNLDMCSEEFERTSTPTDEDGYLESPTFVVIETPKAKTPVPPHEQV